MTNTNTATVTLTDAERLMSPAEAAQKLAGQPERLSAYILHIQQVSSKAKKKSPKKLKAVEYTLSDYKGNTCVSVTGDGKPLKKGVKGIMKVLNNEKPIRAIMARCEKDGVLQDALDAMGVNLYQTKKILSHRDGILKILKENGHLD